MAVILNLAGLRALNNPSGAAAIATPPASPVRRVIGLVSANRSVAAAGGSPAQGSAQDLQAHAATLAREAVYQANNVTGAARTAPPPDVQAAAENAASAAAAHVAAMQADPNSNGQLSGSLAIDTTTGNVSFATLEHKIEALPTWAKLGGAAALVWGIAKLVK